MVGNDDGLETSHQPWGSCPPILESAWTKVPELHLIFDQTSTAFPCFGCVMGCRWWACGQLPLVASGWATHHHRRPIRVGSRLRTPPRSLCMTSASACTLAAWEGVRHARSRHDEKTSGLELVTADRRDVSEGYVTSRSSVVSQIYHVEVRAQTREGRSQADQVEDDRRSRTCGFCPRPRGVRTEVATLEEYPRDFDGSRFNRRAAGFAALIRNRSESRVREDFPIWENEALECSGVHRRDSTPVATNGSH